MSGVESIYHVVNKMIVIEQEEDTQSTVQVARQRSMTVEEESAYDTLENVLKTMRSERHTPFSSSVTQPNNERASAAATQATSKPATPLNERKNNHASNEPELKATVSYCTDGIIVIMIYDIM